MCATAAGRPGSSLGGGGRSRVWHSARGVEASRTPEDPNTRPPAPFVVGAPRSGTTLLRLMLDAHSQLAIPPETGFVPVLADLDPAATDVRAAAFDAITGFPTWPDLHVANADFERALARIESCTVADSVRCFYALYAARLGKERWGDKTPNYGLKLDRVERVLPEAHFVHIIRDGRDVALSARGLWFAPARDMTTLARDWTRRVTTARTLGRSARSYLEVSYERLLAEPERELRRVCEFVDLPFEEGLLEYHRSADARLSELTTWRGAGGEVTVDRAQRLEALARTKRAPDVTRAGRWRDELSRTEVAEFEREAGALLRDLGYESGRRRRRRFWSRR